MAERRTILPKGIPIRRLIIIFGLIFLFLYIIFTFFENIPVNHRGLVFKRLAVGEKGLQKEVLSEGLNFVNGFTTDIIKIPIDEQLLIFAPNADRSSVQRENPDATVLGVMSCMSSDQQNVYASVNIQVAPMESGLVELYQAVQKDWLKKKVIPKALAAVKTQTGKRVAEEMIKTRELITDASFDALKVALEIENIELRGLDITNLEFEKEYQDAVESVQKAKQEFEQQRYETQKDSVVQVKLINQAQAQADAAIRAARGDSLSRVIEAASIAQYNRQINESVTQKVLDFKSLEIKRAEANRWEKWDGNLPHYMSGETPLQMLDINQKSSK